LNSKVFLKVLVLNAIVLRHTIEKSEIDGQIKEKSNLNGEKKKPIIQGKILKVHILLLSPKV